MPAYLWAGEYTLDNLKSQALGDVERWAREGYVSEDTLKQYKHLWQSSTPRMFVQVCFCAWCYSTGPYNPWREVHYTVDASRGLPSELGGES